MRGAAILQLASKYSGVIVQLVLTVVLARILTPSEFGLVATVSVFTNFFAVLSDLGVSVGIVQYRDLTEDDVAGLLNISLLLGLALSVSFCILAGPISRLYGESSLAPLCSFASLSVFFATANAVPNGVLLRGKRFADISLRYVVVSVLSCVASCALAFFGAGAYALAANSVLASMGTFFWNMKASGVRPHRAPLLPPLRKIGRYSGFQALSTFVNYFSRNLDNMLMGLAFGPSALGLYDKAYKLTTYPNTYLTGVVSSVLQPFLSEHQDDRELIWDRFITLTKLCFALGIGAVSVFIAASPEVVEIMYGTQWSESASMLRVLGVSVAFQMCTSMTGAVYQSLGATDWAFRSTVVNTSITVFAVLFGVWTGNVMCLCALVSLAYCVNPAATYWYLVRRSFGRPIGDFCREFRVLLLDATLLWLSSFVLGGFSFGTATLSLIVKLILIAIIYCVVLLLSRQLGSLLPIVPSGLRRRFER